MGLLGSSLRAGRDCPLVSAYPWGQTSWLAIGVQGRWTPQGISPAPLQDAQHIWT